MVKNASKNEKFDIIKLPSGAMFMKRAVKETPEDNIIKIIYSVKKIDFEKAWKEVQKEREIER
jgi:thymidine phosphorylase